MHESEIESLERLLRVTDAAGAEAVTEPLAALWQCYTPRLLRSIQCRMDARLAARLDHEDVLQEGFLAVRRRLAGFAHAGEVSFFVWARGVVLHTLFDMTRAHLVVGKRSAAHEVPIGDAGEMPLVSSWGTPTRAARRSELSDNVAHALSRLAAIDREILTLRHFEELTNGEAAQVLGIHKAAATNRYLRALRRFEVALAGVDVTASNRFER